jgi:hypothetical protein
MSPVYCLIETRDKIENVWEITVKVVCSDMQEVYDLIATYRKDCFDIREYRPRKCTLEEFNKHTGILILYAPSTKSNV